MAKRTVSFDDYQEPTWEEYTGEDPPPNKWFTGTVTKYAYKKDDDQGMFVVEISDPDSPFKGWGRGWYAAFEGDQKWKMQEIVKALQGGKTTAVTLDWESDNAVNAWLRNKKSIKFQTQLYNDRITIRKVRPLMEAVGASAGPKAAALPEPEPEDTEEVELYTEEELDAIEEVGELEEILTEEFETDLPEKPKRDRDGSKYKALLIDAILDAQDEGEEGDENQDAIEDAAEEGGDEEFDAGFDEEAAEEPEPAPAPRARRARAAAPAAPAKKAAPAATTTRRRRG